MSQAELIFLDIVLDLEKAVAYSMGSILGGYS